MNYKLIDEDEQLFHISHPDGSKFSIAKNAIGPEVHKQIKALKMADGGEVEPELEPEIEQTETDQPINSSTVNQNGFDITPISENESRAPASEQYQDVDLNTVPIPVPSQQQQTPMGTAQVGGLPEAYAQSYAQKEAGIKGLAEAQQQSGQQKARAFEEQANQIAQTQQNYQQEHAKLDAEHQNLMNAVMDNKIDPNRFFNSMGTGNKVLAAISVALSGIGSGLTGKSNLAMDVIQKSIERDIESQRMDLGKKQTLLSENLHRYGELNAATQATMLQYNAATQAKVAQAEASAMSPQARAQANIMLGDLKLQAAQLKQKMAMFGVKNAVSGAGGQQGGIPISQENPAVLEQAIPGYGKTRIQVGNRAYQATSEKDAEHLRDFQSEYEPVRQAVTRLGELGADAAIPGTAANNEANAIRSGLVPRLNKMHGLNRLSEEDIKLMGSQVIDPTKFSQLVNGGVKNTAFFKNLEADADSQYATRLKGYKGTASYGFKGK